MARRPNPVYGARKGPTPPLSFRGPPVIPRAPLSFRSPPVIPKRSEESGAGASNTPQPSVRRPPTPTHTPSRACPKAVKGPRMARRPTPVIRGAKGARPKPCHSEAPPCHSEAQRGIWGRGLPTHPNHPFAAHQHQPIPRAEPGLKLSRVRAWRAAPPLSYGARKGPAPPVIPKRSEESGAGASTHPNQPSSLTNTNAYPQPRPSVRPDGNRMTNGRP